MDHTRRLSAREQGEAFASERVLRLHLPPDLPARIAELAPAAPELAAAELAAAFQSTAHRALADAFVEGFIARALLNLD